MHELSIAMSMIDVAAEEAERQGWSRVVAIHLKLGPLAGVVKESLLSAYELAREGSPLKEAELVIEDVPVVAYCSTCAGERGVVSIQDVRCSECGTPAVEIVGGREMEVVALEIES